MMKWSFTFLIIAGWIAGCRPSHQIGSLVEPKNYPMEGTVWRLTELHGKVMIEEANSPTFHLEATGKKVNGFGGCNRFTATYQLNGKTVSCRDAIATKMVCETGMDIENEFFSLLLQMNTFKIRGRELIFLQRGKRVAIFVVQPDRKY